MPDVNLTIDGHMITVPSGTLIVEPAKTVGVEIPVFCYHHKLDPVGACRLCLDDFTHGPPRPQTACTTPEAEGMGAPTPSGSGCPTTRSTALFAPRAANVRGRTSPSATAPPPAGSTGRASTSR